MMDSDMRFSLVRRHFSAVAVLAALAGSSLYNAAAVAATPSPGNRPAPGTTVILVVGDSLSAEYGIRRGSGWVALLEQRLVAEKIAARVVNASISGDTTSGGRSRLDALLSQHRPTHVVIELGGNDAIRGLPLQMTQDNLAHMTQAAQQTGARVLLVGMQVPPNYGQDYARRFAEMFGQVAKGNKAALVPFFLKGIADAVDSAKWFQPDRIHPKEEAHPLMLDNVWPELRKLLK